ncbi:ABC transporter permease [Herbiconiux liukaitaii]|uniref:ABC transporter permease n=1 Tax=Herbiconiux liukaitaii TaxID=3342799 RepID=UPI0035BA3DD5
MEWIDAFFASGVRVTTPILLAALACLPTLWTRDINIGLEGIMIFGAFFGVAAGLWFDSALLAVAFTLLLSIGAGLVFGLLVTKFKLNVFIGGIVLFIFAGAATVLLLDALFGVKGNLSDPGIPALLVVTIPGIDAVPILGAVLSGQTILTWVGWLLVVVMIALERRSVIVRHLRAAGSLPAALATSGVSVDRVRISAQVWCFAVCGLAGVQISLGQLSVYTDGMTGGLGFVALAAAIFSGGRVYLAALVSVGFGFATSLSFQIDKNVMPTELTQMIPYAAAFIGLVVLARRTTGKKVLT